MMPSLASNRCLRFIASSIPPMISRFTVRTPLLTGQSERADRRRSDSETDFSGRIMMTRPFLSGQSLEATLRRRSSQRLIRCLLSVVGIISLGGEATVGDEFWDQWRGPSRDGFVAATAKPWPDGLDQTRLEERWRIALGPSYSGPVLAGNIIIVTETRDKQTEHVRALDRMTGREVWRVNFVEAVKSPLPAFGFVSSPLVVGDYVFVQAAAGFVKLEKATGNIVWRVLEDGGGMWGSAFSSPYPTVLGGVPQILVQTRELLAGVDPENGTVLWKTPVEAFRGMNIVTPTVSGGRVFTTSYGGGSWLFAIDLNRTEEPVEQVWRNKIQGYMSSPIVIDGHAYVHLRNQRFACLDLATGKESWITTPFGRYWSLIAQADRMLALDETGDLRLIRANPERYELIGEAKVATEESWAHLAVVGDEVYVRDLTGLTSLRWK